MTQVQRKSLTDSSAFLLILLWICLLCFLYEELVCEDYSSQLYHNLQYLYILREKTNKKNSEHMIDHHSYIHNWSGCEKRNSGLNRI